MELAGVAGTSSRALDTGFLPGLFLPLMTVLAGGVETAVGCS